MVVFSVTVNCRLTIGRMWKIKWSEDGDWLQVKLNGSIEDRLLKCWIPNSPWFPPPLAQAVWRGCIGRLSHCADLICGKIWLRIDRIRLRVRTLVEACCWPMMAYGRRVLPLLESECWIFPCRMLRTTGLCLIRIPSPRRWYSWFSPFSVLKRFDWFRFRCWTENPLNNNFLWEFPIFKLIR